MKTTFISAVLALSSLLAVSQVDQSKTGAWYMYFYNHQFKESAFGIQGDFQYRDWQGLGDLEQLLLRSGFTYTPKDLGITFTLGYANITTGQFGDDDATFIENRIYQEALIPQKLSNQVYLTHRFRYEQRFVEDQDFRTRYRYNIFVNVLLTKKALVKDAIYVAFYNELFINGQEDISESREVELFDRNRTYFGLGYVLKSGQRIQIGWMNQKTVAWGKGQLQFSFHHSF